MGELTLSAPDNAILDKNTISCGIKIPFNEASSDCSKLGLGAAGQSLSVDGTTDLNLPDIGNEIHVEIKEPPKSDAEKLFSKENLTKMIKEEATKYALGKAGLQPSEKGNFLSATFNVKSAEITIGDVNIENGTKQDAEAPDGWEATGSTTEAWGITVEAKW